MFDLRAIRDDPAGFDRGLARRGLEPKSGQVLALDTDRRRLQTVLQQALARRNEASKEIGEAKRTKDESKAAALMQSSRTADPDWPLVQKRVRQVVKKKP